MDEGKWHFRKEGVPWGPLLPAENFRHKCHSSEALSKEMKRLEEFNKASKKDGLGAEWPLCVRRQKS